MSRIEKTILLMAIAMVIVTIVFPLVGGKIEGTELAWYIFFIGCAVGVFSVHRLGKEEKEKYICRNVDIKKIFIEGSGYVSSKIIVNFRHGEIISVEPDLKYEPRKFNAE